jgi:hypothetical protein
MPRIQIIDGKDPRPCRGQYETVNPGSIKFDLFAEAFAHRPRDKDGTMSTEPHRLQDALSVALNQPVNSAHEAAPVVPTVRYPVPGDLPDTDHGSGRGAASRSLFAASAAMAGAALSVAFNAPSVLLASVASIAVFAAMPLLRRSAGRWRLASGAGNDKTGRSR